MRRGHRVGTVKHTAEDIPLDTPGKDTYRHRRAGSEASAIVHDGGAAFFIDRYLTLNEAVARLGSLDFVVLEGFKSLDNMARIVVPREAGEVDGLSNGLEIAVADIPGLEPPISGKAPVVSLDRPEELADLVEEKSFKMLPGLNCGGCGYDDCRSMAEAILAGEAEADRCVGINPVGFRLIIDDVPIPLGPFVQSVTKNVVLGLVRSLKGVGEPRKVELLFEERRQDG